MDNNNNYTGRPKYIFAFHCKACGVQLSAKDHSFQEVAPNVFVEQELCSKCLSESYNSSYAYEFQHQSLTDSSGSYFDED